MGMYGGMAAPDQCPGGRLSGAGNMPEVGSAGLNLVANVERLRTEQGLSMRRLSALLEKAGRPVPPLGLSRMVRGERRVDVDELLAFAEVFGVTPAVLLADPEAPAPPEHAALRAAAQLAGRIGQMLEAEGDPSAAASLGGYVDRAPRRVQIEVEELLEAVRRAA